MNAAMKILVFSDSHGKTEPMNSAILKESPDFLIHLGDGVFDLYKVQAEHRGLPTAVVKGNCDVGTNEQSSKALNLDGVRIFMAHGHMYGVKSGVGTAVDIAKNNKADIILYGHTHYPTYEMHGELHVFNPGSIAEGRYGIIEVTEGKPFCRLKSLY